LGSRRSRRFASRGPRVYFLFFAVLGFFAAVDFFAVAFDLLALDDFAFEALADLPDALLDDFACDGRAEPRPLFFLERDDDAERGRREGGGAAARGGRARGGRGRPGEARGGARGACGAASRKRAGGGGAGAPPAGAGRGGRGGGAARSADQPPAARQRRWER